MSSLPACARMSGAILIISPEPWEAHAVSKHHYARVLAEVGRRVLFLDPPVVGGKGIEVLDTDIQALSVIRAEKLAPGLRFWPGMARRRLERRWLESLEQTIGVSIVTIWLFENSRFFDLNFAGDRLKIYHQVDLNQRYNQEIAASTADICFCTTDFIIGDLLPHNPRTFKIHHGVAVPGDNLESRNTETHQGGPVATYVGNFNMSYFDWETMTRLIESHPNVTFNLVGGYSDTTPLRHAVAGAPNVRWWGKLPFVEIPPILAASDVLLVTYVRAHQADQASPHKVMEYLYSGKTIVCSYTDEYKDKAHLVEMAEPDEEVDALFAGALAELDRKNAPELQAARRAFALAHSYEKQLSRIEEHVWQELGRSI